MKKRLKILALLLAMGSLSLASCNVIGDLINSNITSQDISLIESILSQDNSSEPVEPVSLNENDEALRFEIYKKAVEAGFQGTYEEWLASIKGADGSTILFGNAAPNNNQGKDTDVFLDVSAWDVYIKANGAWTKLGNIIGNQGPQGEPGQPGQQGQPGKDGVSVVSITKTGSEGLVDTYTITYSDGKTSTFKVTNGQDGSQGIQGQPGQQGQDGKAPEVKIGENGNWFVDNVDTGIKAQGPQGEPGQPGQQGAAGQSLLTGSGEPSLALGNDGDSYIDLITFDFYVKSNNAWSKKGNLKGADGQPGGQGQSGQNGESAYEIAVRLGFQGTEQQWLDSLKGADGGQQVAVKHVVTFDSNGGTTVAAQEVEHGEKARKPENPTRDGYKFIDWIDENEDHWVFNGYCITEDITLYAVWEANGDTPVPHEHTFADKYTYDEEYHWYEATCGHDVVTSKEAHNFKVQVIEPTEDAGGYTLHTCQLCGYSYRDNETNPLEHVHTFARVLSYDENSHWYAATCGHDVRKDEANHTFKEQVVEPTLEAQGYTLHECEVCGYSYKDQYVDPLTPINYHEADLKAPNLDVSTQYNTGNYGVFSECGFDFEYYRAIGAYVNNPYIMLVNKDYQYFDGGLESYIGNTSAILDVRVLEITYRAPEDAIISYSQNRYMDEENSGTIVLPKSEEFVTKSISLPENTNFFKIMTGESNVFVQEIVVKYTDEVNEFEFTSGYQATKAKAPIVVSEPVNGVSKASVTLANGTVKEYTYYTADYAMQHADELSARDVSYVDPIDVSNYYMAFREFPANYQYKNDLSTYANYFGSYLRQVSSYTRTDGYARAVPYNNMGNFEYPVYHELDIDLDGSYNASNSRGVGRLVIWEAGFECYGDEPVIVYTDDHYATFAEYNNRGAFLPRFGAQMVVNGLVYSPATVEGEYEKCIIYYHVGEEVIEDSFVEGKKVSSDILKEQFMPYQDNAEFVGWYKDAAFSELLGETYLSGDLHVYARFLEHEHDGLSLETAFTTAEALAHIDAVGNNGERYYVKGIVTGNILESYSGHGYRFTLDDCFDAYYAESFGMIAPKVGDEIIVRGELVLYNGQVYETASGTGYIAQNVTNNETAIWVEINNMPANTISHNAKITLFSEGKPNGYTIDLSFDVSAGLAYFWASDSTDSFYIIFNNANGEVTATSKTIEFVEDQQIYDFEGFDGGCAAVLTFEDSEGLAERLAAGDYLDCYYFYMNAPDENGVYSYYVRTDGGTLVGLQNNIVIGNPYEVVDGLGEYNMYLNPTAGTFVVERTNAIEEIQYYFENLSRTRDANIEGYLENSENHVAYNTLWVDFALTCFGLDLNDFRSFIAEKGYVKVEGIDAEVYVNVEKDMAIYFSENEGLIEVSTIPYAQGLYGFTIQGFEEAKATYKCNIVDGSKKYYVWSWIRGQNGSWYETSVVDGQLSFEVPVSNNYFIIVEFDGGCTVPGWDYKIRQTSDLYLYYHTSTYEIYF